MKKSKSIQFSLMAMFVLIATTQIISCQSKQDKNAASEQSNDSAFVFSTPKVLKMEDAIVRHFKIGTQQKIESGDYIFPLDILDTAGFLSLSDVADDVEYVLLKTSNGKQEVFIGQGLNNVFICKDYIFVQMCDNIIQYDREGNLIRTIGRKGGGPGEYNWVFNMTVDDKTKRIIINTSGKINEYDFEGNFIRSQKNTYEDQLMPIDSNRIAVEVKNVWRDVKERLVILNKKGEVEKSFPRYLLFDHTDYGQSSGSRPRLTKFHDIICFSEAYNDTIFELKNDELQMRYSLDWGKYAIKPDDVYNREKMVSKALCIYYETDRYLIIPAEIVISFTVVYDKKDNQIRLGYPSRYSHSREFRKLFKYEILAGFFNDLDGGMVQNVDGISLDCQYVFSSYYASDVKEYFEEVGYGANPKYPDKQAKLKALVDTIDEDKHNLLIMMSKLKE